MVENQGMNQHLEEDRNQIRNQRLEAAEEKIHKRKLFFIKHTNSIAFGIMMFLGMTLVLAYEVIAIVIQMRNASILYERSYEWKDYCLELPSAILIAVGFVLFFIYPLVLGFLNIGYLIFFPKSKEGRTSNMITEGWIWLLGILYSCIYWGFSEIHFVDWNEVLINQEVHSPFALAGVPTFAVLCGIAFLGYLILHVVPVRKMPPLMIVICMSTVYIGIFELILAGIQFTTSEGFLIAFFFLNCVIMLLKVIRMVVTDWSTYQKELDDRYEQGLRQQQSMMQQQGYVQQQNMMQQGYMQPQINAQYQQFHNMKRTRKFMEHAVTLPLLALIAVLPLLGILVCILALFGQRPDSLITVFTNTADWALSTKIAPQNVMMDEHYLCTVAAGGHKKVVKPLRLGMRHGHQVVVNRQLCIANAFEQVLEEKTPRFHRAIRNFYDTYGYPIARKIRSKWTADLIYFIMKPLEWLFLIILYAVDRNPENRIAVQYFPMTKEQQDYYRGLQL